MVSKLQGLSIISTKLRSASSLLSLSKEELQDFLLVCFAGCRDFILEHINSAIWILHQLQLLLPSTTTNGNPKYPFYCAVEDCTELL